MNHNINWLTEKQDMAIVSDLLEKHFLSKTHKIRPFKSKEKVSLLEVLLLNDDTFSECLEEIKTTFLEQYGFEHGLAILFNVISKSILKTKKIH